MSEHPDHIDHIALCPDCGGLSAQRLNYVGDVSRFSLTTDRGKAEASGDIAVYVGPIPEPCQPERGEPSG
jgi:hypothetical protein